MDPTIYNKIKNIFERNNGYARTKDILEADIHSSHLYKLQEEGDISRIKRGLYRWNGDEFNSNTELIEVSNIVPNGVICLLSALSYYDLTTTNPCKYYIAIHRDEHRPKLPDYPSISIFYFADKQFNTGIKEVNIEGSKVKIYDKEKTICDCIRLRNKVGTDVVKEAMQNYLKRMDKNISKLLEYAEVTGVKNIVKRYLEVLV
jgi:predicted transcriptional regulator of viral defense system